MPLYRDGIIEYYTYGHIAEILNPRGEVSHFAYDAQGNLEKEQQDGESIQASYNAQGELISLKFLYTLHQFEYDEAGRLSEAKSHSNPLLEGITMGYHANGVMAYKQTPEGTQTHYAYDQASQLSSIKRTSARSQTAQLDYSRDKLGRVVRIDEKGTEDATHYHYNQRGELIEAESPHATVHYSYNAAGNRVDAHDEEKIRYNSTNQLLENETYRYTYDKRGNLYSREHKESKETLVYTFNLFDQLIHIRRYQSDLQQILLEEWGFGYDALNRRITKTYTNHQDHSRDFSHRYLYHEEDIVAILDQEENILATLLHHPAQTDTPLSITNELTQETYTYHADHQGSITHLTNEAGEVVESFTYDAYGTILKHTQTEQTFNPYCYTAREYDTHDLYYYRARYYDPSIGRFISSDPIEFLSGDHNFYRYVGNDPVNWVDPSGLAGNSRAPSGQSITLRDIEYDMLVREYKKITGRYPDTIRAPRPHRSQAEVEGMRKEVEQARREAESKKRRG